MDRKELLSRKVEDMKISRNFNDLVEQMEASGGFGAKHFAEGVKILEKMNKDKCIKFLSFPACIISTGLRGLIVEMIKNNLVDIIVTTCGTLDHDLAKAWGGKYYHGAWHMDDEKLREIEINRLGNVLVPNESYGVPMEKGLMPILEELYKIKKEWSGRELIYEVGKRVKDENSIIYWAAKKNIPVYIPGITDGSFGVNLVWFSQDHDFKVDILADERELAEVGFSKEKTGALIIGGGISKHHTIWWNQFKGGLEYAVYISTATQYDGSLSGARTTEAVSWGKIKEGGHVTIDGDATIILPVMIAALFERLKK